MDLGRYRIGKSDFKSLSYYFRSKFKNNAYKNNMEEASDFLDMLSYLAYRFDEYIEDIQFIEEEKEFLYESWMNTIKESQKTGKKLKFDLQGKPKQKRYYNNYYNNYYNDIYDRY